jgi:hypothetical protein
MERRHFFTWIAAGVLSGSGVIRSAAPDQQGCVQTQQWDWVVEAMKRMLTIQIGMTRGKLKTVFKEEGGLSMRNERTYVSQDCPYFKVRVDFKTADDLDSEDERARLDESDDDIITKISDPFLQFSIMD